ncbi:MAG: ThuA domain-containing protein [Verrucomicrobiota bacterium]
MKTLLTLWITHLALFSASVASADVKPINILLINGGCCHDYDAQGPVLKAIIENSLSAKVTIASSSSNKTDARFEAYKKEDWADGYDLVIHNECSAKVTDKEYVERILKAHRNGVPAVNIHCAMHCYRWGNYKEPVQLGDDNAAWFEMIGLQSSGHGPKFPVSVEYMKDTHPITKGLKDWVTPVGELYNNVQIFDTATSLAMGTQTNKDGGESEAVIVWTSLYGPKKTKTFSVSVGHTSEEMADENFGLLLNRGILWCVGKLDDSGKPAKGYWTEK